MAVATKPSSRSRKGMAKYLALVKRFPLRPLRTERELVAATQLLDRLFATPSLSREEEDYVQVLAAMVERYEAEHHPIDVSSVTPIDMLRHLMEEHGMKRTDVARLLNIGSSEVSMILSAKRGISKSNAKALAAHFNTSVSVFL